MPSPAVQYDAITGVTGRVLLGLVTGSVIEYPASVWVFGAQCPGLDIPTIASGVFPDAMPGNKVSRFMLEMIARKTFNPNTLAANSLYIGTIMSIKFVADDDQFGTCPMAYIDGWEYRARCKQTTSILVTGRGSWKFNNMADQPA